MYCLLLLLAFAVQLQGVVPLSCYYCSDDEADFNYDPDCASYGYAGVSDTHSSNHACYTTIWNDGSKVVRSMTAAEEEDGLCVDLGDRMTCYCTSDNCNNELCDQCFPDPTTVGPPATTSQPGTGLECYSCIGCPEVTEETPTVVSQDHQSCFTSIISGSLTKSYMVIRGGDAVAHVDGDCRHEDGAFICYCSTNLCNQDPAY